MKTIRSIAFILLALAVMTSCELDNYDSPESAIYGALIDIETGDTVQSDIFDGAQIPLVEINDEYENPQIRYLIVKTDGSYRNNLMFDGLYAVPSIENGNFFPTDSTSVTINGDTQFDLEVLPYIRISNVEMTMDGMDLTANFTLSQTAADTINVVSASVFAHSEPTVGKPHRLDDTEIFITSPVPNDSTFTITWDISRSRSLDEDVAYFFRVGAIIDMPGARYNYAPAVRLTPTKN